MEKQIILFGNNSCIFCKKAKEWFEEHGLEFVEKDIDNEIYFKEFETYNVPGVPLVIVVDEETKEEKTINGFLPNKYEELLIVNN